MKKLYSVTICFRLEGVLALSPKAAIQSIKRDLDEKIHQPLTDIDILAWGVESENTRIARK